MQGPLAIDHGARNTAFRPRITASQSPDHCPLPTRFDRRLPDQGARITASRSRFTVHGARAGMFGAWGAGHGAASLTLLMAQCWPVTGIKKPPLVMHQRGRLLACAGLKRLL